MKRLFFRMCRQWQSAAIVVVAGFFSLAYIAAADTLSVTIAGAGAGSVNSEPSGIACPGTCSASFSNLSGISLTATPDWKSLPGVFSVGCSGTGSCFFNINGDTGVTSTFNPNLQAALLIIHPEVGPEFATLTDAYGYAITNNKTGFQLAAREYTFFENLVLTNPIAFTLAGGKNSGYLTTVGFTTLAGYLDVQQGSVEIDALTIR
jgi:hypothetical protein